MPFPAQIRLELSLEYFLTLPAFVKVGCAFSAILVLSRMGLPLGIAMILSALGLTLWSGSGFSGCGRVAASLLLVNNIVLLTVILLLLLFSTALSASGRMDKTVGAFRLWLKSDRLLFAGLPALIGLLPMPGGALFSAPLVAGADAGNRLTPDHKTTINYWFRHIWEYWWPLYPGVILAVQYSGLPLGVFILIQLPFTIAMVIGGYIFLLRKVPRQSAASSATVRPLDLFSTLAPVCILILVSIAGSMLLPLAGVKPTMANLYSIAVGLLSLVLWLAVAQVETLRKIIRTILQGSTWSLMLVVAGALLFSASLGTPINNTGITLVSLMRDEFIGLGVPFFLLVIIIPFISGMVTGIAVAFVGASFPIVFALLGPEPPLHALIATTSLAYVSGHLGQMLSPVHICFLVTKEYFKTNLRSSYRHLWGPVVVVSLAMVAVCAAYYYFLG